MCGPKQRRNGFSLPELILVVVLLGLLAGVVVGGVVNLLPVGRQEVAVGKARILNAARCSYALLAPDAEERWTETGSDEARLGLLAEARVIDGVSSDFLLSQGGYSLRLQGGLREPTLLFKDGASVNYSNP